MTQASPLARFVLSGLPTQRALEQANPRAPLSHGGAFMRPGERRGLVAMPSRVVRPALSENPRVYQ
jgi:hypothetical protein